MPTNKPRSFVPKGLRTTAYSQGGPDEFRVFQDIDTDHGGFEGRGGHVRLAKVADAIGILDADGSNDSVTFPALNAFGTVWTVEVLFKTDTLGGFVLGRAAAGAVGILIQHTSANGGSVVVTITDSAAATTVLTWTGIAAAVVCGLQIVRDGAALTGWLNGTTQTGTMSATNGLATGNYKALNDNGANFYDGGIDRLTVWSVARTTQQDIYRRLYNPRNRNVVYDWVFNQGTNSDVEDRGINNAHATTSGSPTWSRAPLSLSAPVQAIGYNVRRDGTKELVFVNTGRIYTSAVT